MSATPGQIIAFSRVLRTIILDSLYTATEEELKFGHACSRLVAEVLDRGLKTVATEILGSAHGWCINGLGLALYTARLPDGSFQVSLGGEQYVDYPVTGPEINRILKSYGYQT